MDVKKLKLKYEKSKEIYINLKNKKMEYARLHAVITNHRSSFLESQDSLKIKLSSFLLKGF